MAQHQAYNPRGFYVLPGQRLGGCIAMLTCANANPNLEEGFSTVCRLNCCEHSTCRNLSRPTACEILGNSAQQIYKKTCEMESTPFCEHEHFH